MKPRAIKNGTAKKMMRGGMAKKPMMMKAGGTPIKGGKMKMVKKDGKSVPAFAADGVGKMKRGGMAKKK